MKIPIRYFSLDFVYFFNGNPHHRTPGTEGKEAGRGHDLPPLISKKKKIIRWEIFF